MSTITTLLAELRKRYPAWDFMARRYFNFDGNQWQVWAKHGDMGDNAWVTVRAEGDTRSEALEVLVAKMHEVGIGDKRRENKITLCERGCGEPKHPHRKKWRGK